MKRKAFRKGKFHKELAKKSRESHVYEPLGQDAGIHFFDVYHPNVGELEGLTICHVSDLHCGAETTDYNKYLFFAAQDYDYVFLTGDVVNLSFSEITDDHKRLLSLFQAQRGKFYINGNHEQWGSSEGVNTLLTSLEYINLEGKTYEQEGISIAGLPFVHPKEGPAPKQAVFDPNTFNILLTHSLDDLTADSERNIDVVLSGHLHAGEFKLGPINGSHYYRIQKEFLNINKQVGTPGQEFSFLDERCLSYSNPGMVCQMRNKFNRARFGTYQPGMVVLTLKNP